MVQLIAAAALAAFQIASGYQQGEMIRENARLKREIDDLNIESAKVDEFNARKEGYTEASRYQNVIDQTVGEQRAAFAAKGVDVNYGTAAEVQAETEFTGYLNKLDIFKKANERAQGFQKEIINMRLGSAMTFRQSQVDAAGAEAQGIGKGLGTAISGYSRS